MAEFVMFWLLSQWGRRDTCGKFKKGCVETLSKIFDLISGQNVYFSQLYSDLTEAPRKERYKTYPMQVHGAGEHKTLRYVRPKE